MNTPKAAERELDLQIRAHHEKIVEYLREHTTARFLKFRPRTRAVLVLIGATFVIIAWLTPWYTSMVWVNSGGALATALSNGYQVTNVSGGGSLVAQGFTPLIREFNGTALTTGPSALSSIAFTKHDFDCWIGLAVLAVLAMWTYERPDLPGAHEVRRRFHKVIESFKVILLVYVVFRSIWKAVDLGTLGTVNQHSLSALTAAFTAAGVPASDAQDFSTSFSIGLIMLVFGLVFAALSVLSADKGPKLAPDGSPVAAGPTRIRLKSWNAAFIAIIAIMIMYALFQG
jgi:hypothetical protein